MDHESHQSSYDRAVDADELQVTSDMQLDPACRLTSVPAFDGVGDDGRDLGAVALDHEDGEVRRARVDGRPERGVLAEPGAERPELVSQAPPDSPVGVQQRRLQYPAER